MKLEKIGTIMEGQDGAIWNNLLFRFNHAAKCAVYDLDQMKNGNSEAITYFTLDKAEKIMPHSNSVVFGSEYYAEDDQFPLLYTNIYNNYSKQDNRKEGVCCVYRLQKIGNEFITTLVQIIEIGFTKNDALWCSSDKDDARPYGNFVVDPKNNIYYGFTMRDEDKTARYFAFDLPKCRDGETDPETGVKKVILTENDITNKFGCEYHRFIQGACFYDGKIYSLEGFGHDKVNVPALRIINPENKTQDFFQVFENFESPTEPELIDFWDGVCYYADNPGNLYIITDF